MIDLEKYNINFIIDLMDEEPQQQAENQNEQPVIIE